MKVYLNSFHQCEEKSLASDSADPAFRKATANMIAAYNVCRSALAELGESEAQSLSFVVSTQFGEVSSSLDFLTTFYDTQIAKPILFQNSLHNSTLGFVSIQLGIRGPALTLSADERSDIAITETVTALLQLTSHVLVCFVDIVPDFLKQHYAAAYPQLKEHLGWARALIFSKKPISMNAIEIELDHYAFSQKLPQLQENFRV